MASRLPYPSADIYMGQSTAERTRWGTIGAPFVSQAGETRRTERLSGSSQGLSPKQDRFIHFERV
jgi:hypothetical protein